MNTLQKLESLQKDYNQFVVLLSHIKTTPAKKIILEAIRAILEDIEYLEGVVGKCTK